VRADRGVTVRGGRTLDGLEHVFAKVFARTPRFDETTFDELLAEKEQSSRKSGVLEYVPPRFTLDDIGGLDNLKDWLRQRQPPFPGEGLGAGPPGPKGAPMVGEGG